MPMPIAVKDGICFAFPDILQTPSPGGPVPLPYPNIAQLSDATGTASTVKVGGKEVIIDSASIAQSSGGEAGTAGPPPNRDCTFKTFSKTVTAAGKGVVRQFDTTSQNAGNATGLVMGGVASVLVGG